MAPLLLGLLNYAPAMLEAGANIYRAVTGQPAPPEAERDPQAMATAIEALPPEQRDQVLVKLTEAKLGMQQLDTQRFLGLTAGSVEQIRATARPQMALAAMSVVTLFAKGVRLLVWATVAEWLVLAFWALCLATGLTSKPVPDLPSVWSMLADAAPVAEMIWAPLIASFWAAVAIVKKYMGVRERDKAQEYEIQAGKPLQSAQATIQAAGGAIATLARAIRGGQQ